jgi:four helix bundle protein
MGAKSFEGLIAWQLASELEERVSDFISQPPTCRDLKFCDQLRESARSAPRNTAEGFGRFYPKEFSRFLRYAHGSLHETLNQLRHARKREYLTEDGWVSLRRLTLRAIKANSALRRYLSSAAAPDWRDKALPSNTSNPHST